MVGREVYPGWWEEGGGGVYPGWWEEGGVYPYHTTQVGMVYIQYSLRCYSSRSRVHLLSRCSMLNTGIATLVGRGRGPGLRTVETHG